MKNSFIRNIVVALRNLAFSDKAQEDKISKLVDDPDGLDEKYVIKHFLGLSQSEATKMIAEENPFPFAVYTEDLMWMNEEGFTYYFPSYVAACQMVCKQQGKEYVHDLCSGILTALDCHAESSPHHIIKNKEIMIEFINFLEENAEEVMSDAFYSDKLSRINELLK